MTKFRGILFMFVFTSILPFGDALSRLVREDGVSVAQLLFLEYGLISFVVLLFQKKFSFKSIREAPLKKWHLLRVFSFFFAALVWLGVIKHVPLAQLYAVGFLSPIFSSLLSVPLLKETLNRYKIVGLLLGFSGVMVIIRPGMLDISPYLLLAIVSPLTWSFMTVSTKKLSAHHSEKTLLSILAIGLFLLSTPMAILQWVPISTERVPIILLISLIGLLAHFSLIAAYKRTPLTVLAPMEFLTLLFATVNGVLFFNEMIDIWTLAGAFLMITGNIYVIVRSGRGVRPLSSPQNM